MALIRTVSPVPVTYAKLVKTLVIHSPEGYRMWDIIADIFRENSLKNNQRDSRTVSIKVIIRSPSSRIPRNFTEFSKNGDKTRLIELIKDELIKSSQEMLYIQAHTLRWCVLENNTRYGYRGNTTIKQSRRSRHKAVTPCQTCFT